MYHLLPFIVSVILFLRIGSFYLDLKRRSFREIDRRVFVHRTLKNTDFALGFSVLLVVLVILIDFNTVNPMNVEFVWYLSTVGQALVVFGGRQLVRSILPRKLISR